jgi:hypothetical protein
LKLASFLAIALVPALCLGGELQRTSPNPTTYVFGTDFFTMVLSGSGNVTAPLTPVDVTIPPPGGSTSGCEAADFGGFPAGNIALIQRGTCTFATKALNAQAAGASGVIIFNEGNNAGRMDALLGTLGPGVTIPAVFTSFPVGSSLYSLTLSGPVTMHVAVGPGLERIDPNPTTYAFGTDFFFMVWSPRGDVASFLTPVDVTIPPPGGSTSGCEAADFAGFPAGNIALISRGTCGFAVKAANAEAAGASGVIIFNEGNNPGRMDAIIGTLGGPGINIPVVFTSFSVGSDLYSRTLSGPVTMHMSVGPVIEALSPAKLWVGLKNSDAVGLKVDLSVELLEGGFPITQDLLLNQSTGSSGFNNALLKEIPFVDSEGTHELTVRVSARRTCTPGTSHNSGAVRLWYNGKLADTGSGKDAGSRFDATIGGVNSTYFLRNNFDLSTTAGSSKLSADATVDSKSPCPDRPYTPLGTWSLP